MGKHEKTESILPVTCVVTVVQKETYTTLIRLNTVTVFSINQKLIRSKVQFIRISNLRLDPKNTKNWFSSTVTRVIDFKR